GHGIEAAHRGIAPPAPVLADEGVAENAQEPRLEVGARRELRSGPEGPRVGFLDEILGIGVVSREITREVVHRVGVGEGLAPQASCRLSVAHAGIASLYAERLAPPLVPSPPGRTECPFGTFAPAMLRPLDRGRPLTRLRAGIGA